MPWTPCVEFTALPPTPSQLLGSRASCIIEEGDAWQRRRKGYYWVPKLVTLFQIGLILVKLRGSKYIRAKF